MLQSQTIKPDQSAAGGPSLFDQVRSKSGPNFQDLKITKYGDLTIGARHTLALQPDAAVPPQSYSNDPARFRRLIFWQHPRPKQQIRNLAGALRAYGQDLSFAPHEYIAEHADPGVAVGTVFDLLNRSEVNVAHWVQAFSDSVIVAINPTTTTASLVRSITPRCRLLVLGTGQISKNCDVFLPFGSEDSLQSVDVAAAIKHLVQTHTSRPSHAMNVLKGQPMVDLTLSSDDRRGMVFVNPENRQDFEHASFGDLLRQLFHQSDAILVPNCVRLAHERAFHGTDDEKIGLLAQLLDIGMKMKVVNT